MAIIQYAQDFDESMELGDNYYYSRDGSGWAGMLYGYVKSTQVFACPDDSTAPVGQPYICSYGFNQSLMRDINNNTFSPQLSSFNSPSKTILVFECSGAPWAGNATDAPGQTNDGWSATGEGCNTMFTAGPGPALYSTGTFHGDTYSAGKYDGGGIGRHTGGSNYLYADGHVKWARGEDISAGFAAPASTAAQYSGTSTEGSFGNSPYNAAGTDVSTFANGTFIAGTFSFR